MKKKELTYKNFIQEKRTRAEKKTFKKNFTLVFKKIIKDLDSPINTFYPLSRKFKFNFKITELNRFNQFKTIVIIGMGGSVLGSEAIYYFLRNKIKKEFLFFDNIDENQLIQLKKNKKLNKLLFIVVSKSGRTIETLSNLLALKIIKKGGKNIIIISEKNKSPLYLLSKRMKLFHIEHRNYVGGRFSVLSEASMVPAYLMGINILKLRKNILNHLNLKNKKYLENSVIKLTNIFNSNKHKTIVLLNYIPQLDKFLYWLQQLVAESLGKNGKGFFPVISSAPKDHHSLLQLYLDGPKDKIFYIFSKSLNHKIKIDSKVLGNEFKFLNGKTLGEIKYAQKNAFTMILKKKKFPFREIKIQELNEAVLGELFSYFMLETAIIGKLAKINPFDQPAVEQVKVNTKKLLD